MARNYEVLSLRADEYKDARHAPILYERYARAEAEGRYHPDNYADYHEVYGDIAWVYRCVALIASAVADIPVKCVTRNAAGEEEDAEQSDLAGLLDYVNPHSTWYDHVEQTATYLMLDGNDYWSIERGDLSNKPAELWTLRPDRVKVKPDAKDFVGGYVYTVNRKSILYEPQDVLHFKFVNPADDHYGMGPLKAAVNGVVLEYWGGVWNRTVLKRFGAPSVTLTVPGESITAAEEASVKRQWRQEFGSPSAAGKMMLLQGGMKLEPFGLKPDELQWIQTRKMTREEIGAVFGVPPIMMGLYEGVNYATADQQEKQFYRGVVHSTCRKIEAVINEKLAPQFDENVQVHFDFSGVAALQEDRGKLAEWVYKLVGRPILTPNEGREIIGQEEELPGGDDVLVPMNLVPVEEAGTAPPEGPGAGKAWDEFEEELEGLGAEGSGNGRSTAKRATTAS